MCELKNKRILVTGATGLIGSHLVNRLLDEGAEIIAMGRSVEKLKQVFNNDDLNNKFSFAIGNVADGLPSELADIDYIFHAASPISGAEIKTKPVDTISVNLDGTQKCLDFLKSQGRGRMIIFSSATVYGNQFSTDVVSCEENTDKADALHTDNVPYSESKRMIEVLGRAYNVQYQVDTVIVRIGYVYGYTNPKPNTAFYEFIGKAVNGEDIVLNNSGMGRRDNIHVNDVVEALLLVALKGASGEVYNISSNGDLNNYRAIDEMAQIIAQSANELNEEVNVKAYIKPMNGERKPGMKLDNAKIKKLGWQVTVSLEEGIKDTVKRYIDNAGDR